MAQLLPELFGGLAQSVDEATMRGIQDKIGEAIAHLDGIAVEAFQNAKSELERVNAVPRTRHVGRQSHEPQRGLPRRDVGHAALAERPEQRVLEVDDLQHVAVGVVEVRRAADERAVDVGEVLGPDVILLGQHHAFIGREVVLSGRRSAY